MTYNGKKTVTGGGAKRGSGQAARKAGTSHIYIPDDDGDANVISLDERRRKQRAAGAKQHRAAVKRRRKRAVAVIITVLLLGGALAGLYFLLLIDEVRIVGCDTYNEEWAAGIVGISPGDHMWLADTDGARARIDAEPLLEFVSIEREYPSTLTVNVRERLPFAVIINADTAVTIDSAGHILAIGSASAATDCIIVTGLGSGGYQVNENIVDSGNLRASALVAALTDIERFGLADRISVLDVSNSLSVTMTAVSGVTIVIGETSGLEKKFANLAAVLDILDAEGTTSGTLYLSQTGDHVYSPAAAGGETPEEGGDSGGDDGGTP